MLVPIKVAVETHSLNGVEEIMHAEGPHKIVLPSRGKDDLSTILWGSFILRGLCPF